MSMGLPAASAGGRLVRLALVLLVVASGLARTEGHQPGTGGSAPPPGAVGEGGPPGTPSLASTPVPAPTGSALFQYCIVGAGPAGLQMAYYFDQEQRRHTREQPGRPTTPSDQRQAEAEAPGEFSYVLLERGASAGTSFRQYPRHRRLISINKRYTGRPTGETESASGHAPSDDDREFNLRHDWNSVLQDHDRMGQPTAHANQSAGAASPLLFTDFSRKFYPDADELVRYLEAYAVDKRLNVHYNTTIRAIERRVPPTTPEEAAGQRAAVRAAKEAHLHFAREAARLQRKRHAALEAMMPQTGYRSKRRARLQEEEEQEEPAVPFHEEDEFVAEDAEDLTHRVRNDGGVYTLRAEGGSHAAYTCRYLILATGLTQAIRPDLVGAEYIEDYSSFDTSPATFRNQSVLILGKGNSAFETAASLLEEATHIHLVSRSPLRYAHQTHYVGDLRAVNDDLIDVYQLKSLGALLDGDLNRTTATIVRHEETGKLELKRMFPNAHEEDEEDASRHSPLRAHVYDRIINCLGFRFDGGMFPQPEAGAAPPLTMDERSKGKYPAMSSSYESLSPAYPNLYFAGTLQHARDWRRSAGGFIHGFRYLVRAEWKMLMQRNHGRPWPAVPLPLDLQRPFDLNRLDHLSEMSHAVTRWLLHRANTQSAIYQMFGQLTEVLLVHGDAEGETNQVTLEALQDLPIDYLFTSPMALGRFSTRARGVFVLTLEFNPCFSHPHSDVFSSSRAVGRLERAAESNFLHPVIRFYRLPLPPATFRYRQHRPHAQHHVIEDVTTMFDLPERHVAPLVAWTSSVLSSHFVRRTGFSFPEIQLKEPADCDAVAIERRTRRMSREAQQRIRDDLAVKLERSAMSERDEESTNTKSNHQPNQASRDEL